MNNLNLNVEKSSVMQFFSTESFEVSFENQRLPISHDSKFLGVVVDFQLKWASHINVLAKKLSKALFSLRSLRNSVDGATLRTSYFAYFHSLMSYGIIFWGGHSSANKIFKLQKRAIRLLVSDPPHVRNFSCRTLFSQMGILTMTGQYLLDLTVFLKANIGQTCKNSGIHAHNTRQKNLLHLPKIKKKVSMNEPLYAASRFYNLLPSDIKLVSSSKVFKKNLRAWLIEHELYNLKEFEAHSF